MLSLVVDSYSAPWFPRAAGGLSSTDICGHIKCMHDGNEAENACRKPSSVELCQMKTYLEGNKEKLQHHQRPNEPLAILCFDEARMSIRI